MSSLDAKHLPGKQIDQYTLELFLGRGAMGQVFRATDSILKRTVALKLIIKTDDLQPMSSEARKRLIREAQAAGRLSHPNIVTIYSYGETEELQYITMEYVAGKNLAQILRERKVLEIGEVLDIIEQILLALDAACEEGIVHRDIKPANIMITSGGKVKVTDFGLARLHSASALTVSGAILGTPYYMSPEQVASQLVDTRSDIFSTGVVLYELLTGARPFDADSISAIIYKILHSEPPPPTMLKTGIPDFVAGIIKKALSKEIRSRYQNPQEMLKDIRTAKGFFFHTVDPSYEATLVGAPEDTMDSRSPIRVGGKVGEKGIPEEDSGSQGHYFPGDVPGNEPLPSSMSVQAGAERGGLPEAGPFVPAPYPARPGMRSGVKTAFLLAVLLSGIIGGVGFGIYLLKAPPGARYIEKGGRTEIPPGPAIPAASEPAARETAAPKPPKSEESGPAPSMGSLPAAAEPSDANVRLLNSEEEYGRDMGLPQGRYLPSSPSADTANGTPEPNKMRTDAQVAAQVLLGQAEQAYLEGRITAPPGNNTIQYYKQAFALDRENGGIYASLLHAAGESVTRAKTSIARKDFRSARSLVSQAENILQAAPNPPPAQYQPAFKKLAAEIGTLSKMPADSADGKAPPKPDAVAVKQEAPVQPKLLKEDFPSGKILKEDFRSTNP